MDDRDTAAEAVKEPNGTGVRSVRRAVDILGLLSEDRPVITLRQITDTTGLAKTTALRLVQTLEETGLLSSHPLGYTVGPGLWRWAYLARSQWEVPQETRKVMRDLADRSGETVNVFVARDVRRVCVAHEESPLPLRHVVDVGDEQPLWAGASSKILLRDASETQARRIAAASPHGETYAPQLLSWAQEAADRGYAVSSSEFDEGLTAVAVPVTNRSGRVIASLSVSGPSNRFSYEAVERFATDLTEAAALISAQGFSHPFSQDR
ncbi:MULTISPECIES: IclR family transcriptional regulator [Streptomyces]|uniref:IclR family transcriptional regulator n=1 Tax=Streptomyces cylindrosporus TaxID=2927583 RepID=A0ABS9Y0W2_9ACTN|nr:IclR family transcriptional regulator [Streptomyces cylindrosporus]MCI3270659.1 IclR family transcriptional regulator [Streptomyces cylindrosporus]